MFVCFPSPEKTDLRSPLIYFHQGSPDRDRGALGPGPGGRGGAKQVLAVGPCLWTGYGSVVAREESNPPAPHRGRALAPLSGLLS